jgi:acyl carrier protein
MGESPRDVEQTLRSFLKRVGKDVAFDSTMPLYSGGIGLDSLETAELSAVLEDEFGRDPFSNESMPQTVGDIVGFYDSAIAEA